MHKPVMLEETLSLLAVQAGGAYLDGTLGGGGHAEAILKAGAGEVRLLGLDRDPAAVERATSRLSPFADRITLRHSNFTDMAQVAADCGFERFDGILLDLGVSSFQLDQPERGFSFTHDGPLDMRMDSSRGETAAELLARLGNDWRALATLLRDFGEEPRAMRIAKAIVDAGHNSQLRTTAELAQVVEQAAGGRRGAARHPATRTFQALRIAVNAELEAVEQGTEAALNLLAVGGRLAVLTFHSIEDRIVKRTLVAHAGKREALHEGGDRWVGCLPAVRLITRKPLRPGAAELEDNPRARSAKLRVAERIDLPEAA